MLEVCRPPRGTIDDLLKVGPVLRMDALHHRIYCWLNRAVVLENAIGFVCPDNLACVRFPAEAARVTEPLGFGQVRFAPAELLGQEFVFRNVYGRANDSFPRPGLDNRNTNATYVPNFAAGAHNPLGDITSQGPCNHPVD